MTCADRGICFFRLNLSFLIIYYYKIIANASGIPWAAQVSVFLFLSLELLNLQLLNLHLMYSVATHPTAITDVKPLQSCNSDK